MEIHYNVIFQKFTHYDKSNYLAFKAYLIHVSSQGNSYLIFIVAIWNERVLCLCIDIPMIGILDKKISDHVRGKKIIPKHRWLAPLDLCEAGLRRATKPSSWLERYV